MQNRNSITIGVIIAVIIIFGAVLFMRNKAETTTIDMSGQNATGYTNQSSTSPADSSMASSSAQQGAVKEFTIAGSNYKFEPSTITVNKGDTVKITFTNSGGIHNFVLDEFNVSTKTIPSGQTETVQFVADKTGQFSYYCSVGNHRAMGMEGTLIVQ